MKQRSKIILSLLVLALLSTGCSRKGIHMSKHRKSRKCNCPTFTEAMPFGEQYQLSSIYYGDTRRGI
ncbi:MAG: hypothetical protein K6A67_09335 [Bacteroidales bacterium]|nr:hypothetical protein [Bacteroidales bacterium]